MNFTEKDLIDIIPELRLFARSRCYKQVDADDLVQETLLRALRYKKRFHGGKLIAWTITIMKNIRIDYLRRSKENVTDNVDDHPPSSPDNAAMMEINDLTNALKKLSEKCREVLVLAGGGYSYIEISHDLNIEKGTVMSRLSRCREQLIQVMYG